MAAEPLEGLKISVLSENLATHRYESEVLARALSDFMEGESKAFTLPTLDLEDFIGLSFVTGPDGKIYQLPDQQFANLYWFRYDWFQRPELRAKFRERYGYELGVPLNWSAYEDIADVLYGSCESNRWQAGIWAYGLRQARPVTGINPCRYRKPLWG